jgi:hypothetical protein
MISLLVSNKAVSLLLLDKENIFGDLFEISDTEANADVIKFEAELVTEVTVDVAAVEIAEAAFDAADVAEFIDDDATLLAVEAAFEATLTVLFAALTADDVATETVFVAAFEATDTVLVAADTAVEATLDAADVTIEAGFFSDNAGIVFVKLFFFSWLNNCSFSSFNISDFIDKLIFTLF